MDESLKVFVKQLGKNAEKQPGLVIAIVLSLELPMPWALVLLAIALLCAYMLAFQVYPRLKSLHRINLYRAVVALPAKDQAKITCQELGTVCMFFWEGSFLVTAPKPANPTLNTDVKHADFARSPRAG